MSKTYDEIFLNQYKREHPNHRCIYCKHRLVYAYEDDTPASYTPYHYWQAVCELTRREINSDEMPTGCLVRIRKPKAKPAIKSPDIAIAAE